LPDNHSAPAQAFWYRFLAWAGVKSARPTKPFSRAEEAGLKQESAPMAPIKQRASVMLGHIINLFYRGLCKQYLLAIRHRRHRAANL
jgi:hypothetical protein